MILNIKTQYLKDPDNEIEIEDIKDIKDNKVIYYLLIFQSVIERRTN